MAKRYELRIDGDEFREMEARAQVVGCKSVAEYLRKLHRLERERLNDETIVAMIGRATPPKVR